MTASPEPRFGRILLKLSGEALMGSLDFGTDGAEVDRIAGQVSAIRDRGVEVAIVVGAGNIYRGLEGAASGMDRATGDYMGMLATVLNALTLQDALERLGQHTRVMSAIDVKEVAEPYIRRRAMRHLEKGRVVIFAAGTGNPFFTTDTAAALRALEIHAEAILMAKNGVEGVYDADPATNPDAKFIPAITHREAIERGLKVMDSTALSLCMDNDLPIYVFNMGDETNIDRIVSGEKVGTLVSNGPPLSEDGNRGADRRTARGREGADGQVGRVEPWRAGHGPHRPRLAAPARPHRGRLLRQPRRRSSSWPTSPPPTPGCSPSPPSTRARSAAIEKAIQESDVGLTPSNDGNVIRLQIPELTEERRREMVKVVNGVAEEGRVAIRNVRRDVMHDLRELKKEGEAGEDDERRAEAALQKQTDDAIAEIDALLKGKEEEILEV